MLRGKQALGSILVAGPGRQNFAATHPDQVLARSFQLRFPAMTIGQAQALRGKLISTGVYHSVEIVSPLATQFHAEADELTNRITSDPHHKQWSFPQLNMAPALLLTKGRALISSIDGGLVPINSEIATNLRSQWSAFDRYTGGNRDGFFPNALNDSVTFVGHGMHTSGIMAAAINSVGANPQSGTGIVGICPSCSFATMRQATQDIQTVPSLERGYEFLGDRIGATAINFSGGLGSALLSEVKTG